jgi:hypothetical protein
MIESQPIFLPGRQTPSDAPRLIKDGYLDAVIMKTPRRHQPTNTGSNHRNSGSLGGDRSK